MFEKTAAGIKRFGFNHWSACVKAKWKFFHRLICIIGYIVAFYWHGSCSHSIHPFRHIHKWRTVKSIRELLFLCFEMALQNIWYNCIIKLCFQLSCLLSELCAQFSVEKPWFFHLKLWKLSLKIVTLKDFTIPQKLSQWSKSNLVGWLEYRKKRVGSFLLNKS